MLNFTYVLIAVPGLQLMFPLFDFFVWFWRHYTLFQNFTESLIASQSCTDILQFRNRPASLEPNINQGMKCNGTPFRPSLVCESHQEPGSISFVRVADEAADNRIMKSATIVVSRNKPVHEFQLSPESFSSK